MFQIVNFKLISTPLLLFNSIKIYLLSISDIWLGEEVASFKCIVKLCLISGHNFKLQYLIYLFVVWHFCICLIANSFCNFADTILYRRKFSTIYLSLSYTVGIHCFCAQHLWVLNNWGKTEAFRCFFLQNTNPLRVGWDISILMIFK